jgi:hypothetical protein
LPSVILGQLPGSLSKLAFCLGQLVLAGTQIISCSKTACNAGSIFTLTSDTNCNNYWYMEQLLSHYPQPLMLLKSVLR